jgi:ribosomal protein L29
MAILKNKEISKMGNAERDEKINDLKMELMKEKVNLAKGGKIKIKEIKRTIARLLTFNRLNKSVENK